jgi:hypothetical protein
MGKKMSATHADATKIMLLEASEDIASKMENTAWQTEPSKNAFLMTLRDILVPLSELHLRPTAKVVPGWQNPSVDRNAPAGTLFTATAGNSLLHFAGFDDISKALGDGRLEAADLQRSVASAVENLLAPMQGYFNSSFDWQAAAAGGYPS